MMLAILWKIIRNELLYLLCIFLMTLVFEQFLGISDQHSIFVLFAGMFAIGFSTFKEETRTNEDSVIPNKTKIVKIGPIPIVVEDEHEHRDNFRKKTRSRETDHDALK